MRNQWDNSGASESGWIRLHASVSSETKTIHRINFRNSTLSILIKVYLLFSPSSNEVFFTAGTSH